MLIVKVDVDDVVADLLSEWLKRYNRDYQDCVTRDDFKSWDMTEWISSECGTKIYDYLRDPTLYDHVEPIEGAWAGIQRIRARKMRPVFVTSANDMSMGPKYRWLVRHGFLAKSYEERDFVMAYDKALVLGDIIVDDRPENVMGHEGHGRILFDQPHNRYWDVNEYGAQRVRGWEDMDWALDMAEFRIEQAHRGVMA